MQNDPEFQVLQPNLLDNLVFINTRLMLPFMLNKSELSDPSVRREAYKMNKGLKDLYINHYCQFKNYEKYYIKSLTHRSEHNNFQRHIILSNISQLLGLGKISDEYTL